MTRPPRANTEERGRWVKSWRLHRTYPATFRTLRDFPHNRSGLMPALPSSNPAQFVQGAPVLHVADVEATAAFYRDVLGFTWDFGDETYAVVWRDNSAIHDVRVSRTAS